MAQDNNRVDLEHERYKDWDMSNAKPANLHPMVSKLQKNVRQSQLKTKKD